MRLLILLIFLVSWNYIYAQNEKNCIYLKIDTVMIENDSLFCKVSILNESEIHFSAANEPPMGRLTSALSFFYLCF